jgi:hypothetical protein
MRPIRSIAVVIAALALGGATMAFAGSSGAGSGGDRYQGDDDRRDERGHDGRGRVASATLIDATGQRVGRIWMREDGRDDVRLYRGTRERSTGRVPRLPHPHDRALRRADVHHYGRALQPDRCDPRRHAGDLPSLLVIDDGEAFRRRPRIASRSPICARPTAAR